MSDKASPDEPLPTRTEAEGATVDLPEGLGFSSVGQVLGERYEILERLGRSGMGEVWRAFDFELRVGVALETVTHLRDARNPESATGWKLTHDPFPGWETVPAW